LTSETWKDSGGGSIHAFEWSYDLVGNRTYQYYNNARTYYTYDAGNQLTKYHELPADEWTYFAYDTRGNTTRIQRPGAPGATTYFTYNDADRVTSISHPWYDPQYYYYDARLRRTAVERITAGVKSAAYFVWDKNGMNELTERSHGHTPVDGIGSLVVQGTAWYGWLPVYDHRGSVVRGIYQSAGGDFVSYFEYNAWGHPLRVDPMTWPEELRYQTNWERIGTYGGHDLYRTKTRVYNATLGRFLQKDPLDKASYIYCYSNPLSDTDARGAAPDLEYLARLAPIRATISIETGVDQVKLYNAIEQVEKKLLTRLNMTDEYYWLQETSGRKSTPKLGK